MALKSMLLMLALMLTITKMVSSLEDTNGPPELQLLHHPQILPVTAPVHAPKMPPTHSPSVAPVHAPTISPTKPPVMTTDCRVLCKAYCQLIRPHGPFTPCMRSCKPCCDRLHCVPKTMTCRKWNRITVVIHGIQTKCPSKTTMA